MNVYVPSMIDISGSVIRKAIMESKAPLMGERFKWNSLALMLVSSYPITMLKYKANAPIVKVLAVM